jgi:D-amino-acid dehydrogenase
VSTEVVVIGGGVAGASAAYTLARNGARVTVVDRRFDGEATAAGAGIISIGASARFDATMFSLGKAAAAFYPTMIEQLADDGETNTGYDVVGALHIAIDDEEAARLPGLMSDVQARQSDGLTGLGELSLVSNAEARELFPPMREIAGALYIPGAARVVGRLLRESLLNAARKHGARVIDGEGTVVHEGGQASGVQVDDQTIAADAVIIASGAWSSSIGASIGVIIPVYPQRGQIVHLDVPDIPTGTWAIVVGYHSHYIVTFPTNRVVVGATREDAAGFDYRMTAAGVNEDLSEALRIAPGLASATLQEVRIGFRPASPDGLPIMGAVGEQSNIYVCTGHGPSGLQLAPYSGAAIADMVLGKPVAADLSAMSPARFP